MATRPKGGRPAKSDVARAEQKAWWSNGIASGPHLTESQERALSFLIFLLIVLAFVALVGTWLTLVIVSFDEVRTALLIEHYVAIVGLPAAGAAAFVLVFLFRQTSGPIEIEAFGTKFRGATGPLVLWNLCFLSMAAAIKMVW